MFDHDGILALMRVGDPTEKRLALKSKMVEPYHLRHALQDPDLRATAALHPKLTPELISEITLGSDHDLKSLVLQRPDLTEEHLENMAFDPDFAEVVARHPKCPEKLRHQALQSNVPDEAKAIHEEALNKNIGYITFPLLGEGKVHQKAYEVKVQPKHTTKDNFDDHQGTFQQSGATLIWARPDEPTPHHRRRMPIWATASTGELKAHGTKQTQARTFQSIKNPSSRFLAAQKVDNGKSLNATAAHETQHGILGRLAQKYGLEARERVVGALWNGLDPVEQTHLTRLFSRNNVGAYGQDLDREEAIAHSMTYLQDPVYRDRVYNHLGISHKTEQQDHFHQTKQIWHKLRKLGMSMRPEDVGVDPKKENRKFKAWIKKLSKRESSVSDQLGFSVSFHELIAIASFLTKRVVENDAIRAALHRVGGDPLKAVLSAYGLDTEEGRKSFESVRKLRLHKSDETLLRAPRAIVGISPGSEQFAADLVKAYQNNSVSPVRLGGKHSSGTYLASVEEGNWLLKPGSGKKSPAAGVSATEGSQSRREVLFGALAQALGIHEVRPSHLLNIDGREVAAIQMWPMDWSNLYKVAREEDGNLPVRALEPYRKAGKLHKWAVLDFIAGNPDRHGNNLLIGPEDKGNQIGLIDHGSAFAGTDFDPGNDQNSFVPYYLRVWAGDRFHELDAKKKLESMPRVGKEIEDELRAWVDSIKPEAIEAICHRYGMDAGPVIHRLAQVQEPADSAADHINSLFL